MMDTSLHSRPKQDELLFSFQTSAETWQVDCVVLPLYSDEPPLAYLGSINQMLPGLKYNAVLLDLDGAKNSINVAYTGSDASIPRVVFVGLGKRDDLDMTTVRNAMATAAKEMQRLKISNAGIPMEAFEMMISIAKEGRYDVSLSNLIENCVLGVSLGVYSCEYYKSKKDEKNNKLKSFQLLCKTAPDKTRTSSLERAIAISQGIYLTRDLVNGPSNIITPQRVEQEAEAIANRYGFKFSSLRKAELEALGMGAFLSVASGSYHEPRMIILEYIPQGCSEEKPIVLVGKGVTFDTGGISLKPSAKMHHMKGDMAGAATVLGVFRALGELREAYSNIPIVGIIPCSDNKPDAKATNPGDIVKTHSGLTVEITNTDAEGRLLLCDGMSYAQSKWSPSVLIDIATLTGACVVALGEKTAGVFSNSELVAERVIQLGEKAGERFWHLPVYDDDIDLLKSDVADLDNTGPREGGASTAALFLKQFVKPNTPWAHIDIAGPAYITEKSACCPGGATAFGLLTLLTFIKDKNLY